MAAHVAGKFTKAALSARRLQGPLTPIRENSLRPCGPRTTLFMKSPMPTSNINDAIGAPVPHDTVEFLPGTPRLRSTLAASPVHGEETIVADDRAGQSPAQVVEAKLTRLLKDQMLPVSHLQARGLLKRR
jgi:hypothetical protein